MYKKFIENKTAPETINFFSTKEPAPAIASWPGRKKELTINLKETQAQIKTNSENLKTILKKDQDIPFLTLNNNCPQIIQKLTALKIYFSNNLFPTVPVEAQAELAVIQNNLLNNIDLAARLIATPTTSPELLINLLIYIDRSVKDISAQKPYFKELNNELLKKAELSLTELYTLLSYKKGAIYINSSEKSESLKARIKNIKNSFTSEHKYHHQAKDLQTLANEYAATSGSVQYLKQNFLSILKQQHHADIKDLDLVRLSKNFILQLQTKESLLEGLFNQINHHVSFLESEINAFIIYKNADNALHFFFKNNYDLPANQRYIISKIVEGIMTALLKSANDLSYPVANKIAQRINELLIQETDRKKLLELLVKYYKQLNKMVLAAEAKAAA